MKKLYIAIIAVLLLTGTNLFAQAFTRVGEIPVQPLDTEGYANFIAGMDMDNDGFPEIVAVNQNQTDEPSAVIPRIYKYEYNGTNGWNLVWSATLDIPLQNSWPALTYGDMDKDGKGEIWWGPVNFFGTGVNLNPARVIVFESRGGGSDLMGVASGENSLPNAKWTITDQESYNLRPFRWFLHDIDSDGTTELIFADRATNLKFGIISASNIPDNGNGSETWTLEFSGLGQTIGSGTHYDLAVMGNMALIISDAGNVTPVTYSGGAYSVGTVVAAGIGSWKSASVVDINKDGIKEIVIAGFAASNQKIYLVQESLGNITVTAIADLSTVIGAGVGRIYGGASGDIDLDGNLDFVFGSRGSTPDAAVIRMEYAGGDITNPNSYVVTIIDQGYSLGGRWDQLAIAQIDEDVYNEVLYTVGFDNVAPIVILDWEGKLPVELKSFSASAKGNSVVLNWATATETNNRGFEIERSYNGGNFATVAFVTGKGTTNDPQSYSFAENNLEMGKYSYRLKQVDFNGSYKYSEVVEIDLNKPAEFTLDQNYPNPFNPSTTIRFSLKEDANVKLAVYNLVGEEVALLVNDFRTAGVHHVNFDASTLSSGTYIYRIESNGQTLMNKMILMK